MLQALSSSATASLQHQLTKQYANSLSNDGTLSIGSKTNYSETVNYVTFNQDASCVAIGLTNGYKIFNCQPNFGRCFQYRNDESIGIVEMLYCTSLLAIVAQGEEIGSSPRKLKIINTKTKSTICDLTFSLTVLHVKLTNTRLIVVLEDQIYLYDITTMKLLHTIETSPNLNGLCAISYDDTNSYLAYPSPPKTITHDSLLASGINTNGGQNSAQNNIVSVSNAPNRIGDVIIFNVNTLQPLSVIEAHKSTIASMAFSNDGSLLATASDKGTIVRVFDVATGTKLYQFRRGTYPTKIYSLRFSADDKYVLATSSSLTVHIFRLGDEEALANKQMMKKKKPTVETIAEEGSSPGDVSSSSPKQTRSVKRNSDEFDDIADDGDDSDVDEGEDEEMGDDESIEVIPAKQRKLSQGSSNSYASVNSEDAQSNSPKTEPLIDQNRLSVARMIRRSSQTLGRKAAQKMGDFLPSRFSSILEPTRSFASLKINAHSKDAKSVAAMNNVLQQDLIPQSYLANDNACAKQDLMEVNLLHIYVVTTEGMLYIYGLDPERGGDCILLNQHCILDE
ncbi:Autophagy-related protein 18 [Candida viswanathii]|uniref:Autophagy-related protein 18 n=1 Tax=Candida viswanathii TaxID=5486 RepID=A0A367XQ83_9ASCO|nr:Autophagy-related protein 18 [Candida viswanathii]